MTTGHIVLAGIVGFLLSDMTVASFMVAILNDALKKGGTIKDVLKDIGVM